jgi:hypothetical protein
VANGKPRFDEDLSDRLELSRPIDDLEVSGQTTFDYIDRQWIFFLNGPEKPG